MKEIVAFSGQIIKIDNEDFDLLSKSKWYVDSQGYATKRTKGNKYIRMHKVLLDAVLPLIVDHINGDKLDNQKKNLRLASKSQNGGNSNAHKDSSTGLKGVSFDKRRKKPTYYAKIYVKGKHYCLGTYRTAEEAAAVYDIAAIKYFGAFAKTNYQQGSL